ncbi:GNAT family N-acetyltransferase [Roseateles saccharophilus]|uniref:Ribosomal protein S18 acetylase RimI-like enzyme n=1 Tax=Roseateles saccharophilus TaxID=304 RepID=A0A4R3UCW2_ROSSA|nr:GNAT family N-acetyltransferase [Roseateles saccharophilus]MDG0835756.1 GNAT family N-acetyltransferase [Roseateles saccharophilus]TCU84472.1 ribosomal protein S18 acetylase RimI-like enzyme [Roseateles saccharophilus]
MMPRRARPADAACLAALAQWVWLDSYATQGIEARFLPYLAESFRMGAFERLIVDPERVMWVLEEGAVLQGFAQLRRGAAAPVPGGAAPRVELERLYVAPRLTGRGLGVALMAAARSTWPAEALWLSVWAGNEGAQRFYRREGGEVIGETTFVLDGQAHPNLVFGWPAR